MTMLNRRNQGVLSILTCLSLLGASPSARAGEPDSAEPRRPIETLTSPGKTTRIQGRYRPYLRAESGRGITDRGPGCPITAETRFRAPRAGHPEDFDFDNIQAGQQIVVQAGLIEGEIAAQSYQINNLQFPLKIEEVQIIIGSVANLQTTTRYTVMLWDGTPSTGTLLYSASSDSQDPAAPADLVLPPRPAGGGTPPPAAIGDLHFSIDNGGDPTFDWRVDPIVDPITGEFPNVPHTITIGFRIDQHNNQSGNGCGSGGPGQNSNAFPCTEPATCCVGPSLLTFPTENWLFMIACPGGCGSDWATFSQLSANGCLFGFCTGCRPSGDWALRMKWSSLGCLPPSSGACCAANGSCQVSTQAGCTGTYQGDDSACTPNPCPQPQGACCESGVCTTTTQAACGGSFQGVGTTCGNVNCPQPQGACCFSPTSCQLTDAGTCSGFGGTFGGPGTTCSGSNCPTGACCLPSGGCVAAQLPSQCTAQGGTLQAVGSVCTPNPCPQPQGACCNNSNNFCSVQTEAFCGGIANTTWQGPGTGCTPNPCGAVATGACCCGSTCTLTTAAACTGAATAFSGVGTVCNAGGSATTPCCQSDYNQSGGAATVQDIFDFLSGYFSSDPCSDFNGSGTSVQDIFDFLGAYFAGGC